jgi:hypothetical protein
MYCFACGEEKKEKSSNLIYQVIDAVTWTGAICRDCNKIYRIGDVLSNFLAGDEGNPDYQNIKNKFFTEIATRLSENTEFRNYLNIPKEKVINIEALVKGEDNLDERERRYLKV